MRIEDAKDDEYSTFYDSLVSKTAMFKAPRKGRFYAQVIAEMENAWLGAHGDESLVFDWGFYWNVMESNS